MNKVSGLKTRKEVETVRTYLKGKDTRYYLLFSMGITSAFRISDLLDLRLGDLFDEDLNIKERVRKKERKTGKYKEFIITKKTREALEAYKNEYGIVDLRHPVFFGIYRSNVISRQWARKVLSEAVSDCGIKEAFGSHGLRKTWGTLAFKSGVSLDMIAIYLNHRNISTTKRYLGLEQEDIDEISINLDL